MAWWLDTTRIFVVDRTNDQKQIIAKLQPINAGTIYHVFGYENRVAKINGYIVGDTDYGAITAMTQDGETHLFSGAYGYVYPYYVNTATFKQVNCICQTLRPDLDSDAPVWQFDIELLKETG